MTSSAIPQRGTRAVTFWRFVRVISAMSLVATTARAHEPDPALIAAATAEGKVVWYTGLIEKEAAIPMAAAFMRRYPGIEAQVVRLNGEETARRIVEHAARGTPQADVFDSSTSVAVLVPAGLVEPYRSASAADIPAAYKDPDGNWASQVVYYTTIGFNTDLVAAEQAPATFEALLDPKWRGKMGWSSSGVASSAGFVGNVLLTMGEQRGLAYLERLRQQQIRRLPGGGNELLAAVARGEVAIGLQIFNHHTLIQKKTGAHVGWVKFESLLGFSNPIGLVKNGPHPNAGKLLIDFVLSEPGQRVLARADHIPASSKVDAPDPDLKVGFAYHFVSPQTVERDLPKWREIAKRLFP